MRRDKLAAAIRSAPADAATELLRRLDALEADAFVVGPPSIWFVGDSRMYGSGCTNGSLPTGLPNATDVAPAGGLVGGWANLAIEAPISGIAQPVTKMCIARNSAVVGTTLASHPNGIRAASLVVLLGGTNDVIAGTVGSAAELYAAIVAAHGRCLDLPFSPIGSQRTLAVTIPQSDQFTGGKQALVDAANVLLRNAVSPPWAGLLDLDAIIGPSDLADGLHFNNAGHVKAANAAVIAINTILNAS